MTVQALVEALLSIPLYGFQGDGENGYSPELPLSIPLYGFHSIFVLLLPLTLGYLSIPLYGFISKVKIAVDDGDVTFNSIVWIRVRKTLASAVFLTLPFNSIVWIHEIEITVNVQEGKGVFQFHCMDSGFL